MKILFILACACVIAATIGAVAIGLSLFTQPEAYAFLTNVGSSHAVAQTGIA